MHQISGEKFRQVSFIISALIYYMEGKLLYNRVRFFTFTVQWNDCIVLTDFDTFDIEIFQ